ncbi:Phage-related lysozyme (muramidase), GH24 family [Clostridium acidisoli DSM 12555]|uniref:Lysozyme n=1 Tax=Clostridium acidisoli DSM 12555 TaxID=1121291 RepID=A0A1W1X3Z0_9CLOT|nr:FG-GAP-like repeat-containing protein [Clostridium acidisoli]SMC18646.1 Phage-related lysozyme (muramidase), GH24 family [Clostridium acidisoli DSM 12555]
MKSKSIFFVLFLGLIVTFMSNSKAYADVNTNGIIWKLHTATPLSKTDGNWSFAMGSYNNDGKPDIYCIKRNGGNGKTELHILNGANNYQSFLLETATALPETDGNWQFLVGDYNHDGKPDLYCIKENGANGKTEVHILNGADNYQSFLYETATTLPETDGNWQFAIGDYNNDGKPDLYCIKENGANGKTEVHILNGANNYQSFLLETATALPETDGNWQFGISDYNNDGVPDLYCIKKNGSGATEVHILNGSNNFQSFLFQSATPMEPTDQSTQFIVGQGSLNIYAIKEQGGTSTEVHEFGYPDQIGTGNTVDANGIIWKLHTATPLSKTDGNWSFAMGDYNNDGKPDIYCIKKSESKTEVHILNGANNYQSFLLETATALPQTDGNWQFAIGDYNHDGKPDLYCIKENGGNGKTEVHILNGADNYQSFLLEIATVLPQTDGNWQFAIGDYNHDGKPDLYCIKGNGGNGKTEVHILNGADNYQSFLLETATGLSQTDSNWQFGISDYNNDGVPDLYCIKKNGSGATEVHILNGANNFQSFLFESATPMEPTDQSTQFIVGQGSLSIYAIKEQGGTSTEVHEFGYQDNIITGNTGDTNGVAVNMASANIIYFIKECEGFAPSLYHDSVGVLTGGYGMTGVELNGLPASISETTATNLLTNHVNNEYYKQVLDIIHAHGVANPLQREVDAFTSFAYNNGINAFSGSTLLKLYASGSRGADIQNQFMQWVHAGDKVLPGLVTRRTYEWEIFSGSNASIPGYNCAPSISYINTAGNPTGQVVTNNNRYGASPY